MVSEELLTKTLQEIKELIADETGNNLEEIVPEMHLEDELEIVETKLTRLINIINTHFNIELSAAEIEEEESVETVRQLAVIVAEEIELG